MSNPLHTPRTKANATDNTSASAALLQRQCACSNHTPGGGECDECKKKREGVLQRAAVTSTSASVAPPIVHEVLRSPGQPLDAQTRAFMEPRFGHDFSNVRVHTDAQADQSAQAVNAIAYTVRRDVVFGAGRYAPHTSAGRKLMAHELTHVIQQSRDSGQHVQAFRIGEQSDVYEQDANRAAEHVTQMPAVPAIHVMSGLSDAPGVLRRAPASAPAPIGPASAIPEDRGDIERGYFATTDKVMYGVRASGPAKPTGLWMDHLFETQAEAEAYAQDLAAKGAPVIREQSALPYAWPAKTSGGMPVTGNPVTHVYVVEIPKGTSYVQGVVREQPENRNAPWLKGKIWGGGGPQVVVAWDTKMKSVAEFSVAKPAPTDSNTALPPPVIATSGPRAVGSLYAPKLVQDYRTQQLLYQYSQAALDDLDSKTSGGELSNANKEKRATLVAQVAAAEAQMTQARKDYELIKNPAATPQQIQEMLTRHGVAVPVNRQSDTTSAAALKGSGLSALSLDEKGVSKRSGQSNTRTIIGPDDKPVTITDEDTSSVNVGFLTAKRTSDTKISVAGGDSPSIVDTSKTVGVDLAKGEGSIVYDRSRQTVDDAGTATKTANKTTFTGGVSGVTRTTEDSTQIGSKLDSKSTTLGVTREPGQAGFTVGQTTKSGKMVGPPDQQVMDTGSEKTNKLTASLVSDDKGVGVGGAATQGRKTMLGDGKTVEPTVAAGGRCQAKVVQIPGSDPPRFLITTTISFDLKLGATAGKEWQATPGAQQDTGLKSNVSASAGAAVGVYAAFTRRLSDEEARDYIDFIKSDGNGGSLPEHKILVTGMSQGWDAAKKLWQAMKKSPSLAKSFKPGEEVVTNLDVSGDAKLGAGGGESGTGGTSLGIDVSAKGKHGINVRQVMLPNGQMQLIATINDEGEVSGGVTAGYGVASTRFGKSYTQGQGRIVTFVLDPKSSAFDSQFMTINAATTPQDLDQFAAQNPGLVSTNTEKKVTGEGSDVTLKAGFTLNMGGKGALTSELTRDSKGQLVSSKFTGENQGGGTVGVSDAAKVGSSTTEAYVGGVDKQDRATGTISETKRSTSIIKSVMNAGDKIVKNPVAVVTNPGKLLENETESKGTDFADPEIMSFCYAALDAPKWNGKIGGYRHDVWVATGAKIRRACTVRGKGREAEIVSVDKHAVQEAMATWMKADAGGRKESIDAIIRPLGGTPGGKAYAFPDGTEDLKTAWDELVKADPLDAARAKLAAHSPQEALTEMKTVKGKVYSLFVRIKHSTANWEGKEIQRAEMLGHINTRVNEIDTAIHDLLKTLPAAPKTPASGTQTAATTKPSADEIKAQEDRQRADDARADLEVYNNNIETMQSYADSVFRILGEAEAKVKKFSFFSNASSRLDEAGLMIKDAEDLIKKWDALYWPTFKLYEKWSPYGGLDRSRIEKLHTAGARGRWNQVYDLTRDTSMPGRHL